ncbi:hypothetical protein QCA50_017160 [Cerrena zonata]|uniref:DUF7082 domain-containing protein n=1 Tax=Cerrena zonata TaxID=2478898 RepID=A0AAW0FQQ6_9APHY
MTSNDKSSIPWTKGNVGDSNLIRTSSLDPDYIRQNLNLINTPVKLLFEKDVNSITLDWSQDEMMNERRLVQFNFNRISPTDFWVEFNPIAKKNYTPEIPIISCIYWKEKDIHIVTSVDIILILEYLVQESFSIEEKNRIRRNLQSLKPYTISRTNSSLQRFFNLLMSMEDPRPRNIEKDLKVFKCNTSNNNTPNGGGSSSATITDDSNSSPDDLDKISNERDSNDSSANELSNEKSGFAAVAAEQKKSPNNDSELASAPESTEILELNSTQGTPNSNDENATGSRSNEDSGGASLSGSGISGSGSGSGSSGSNLVSSNTGLSSNIFSSNDQNSSTQPSSNTSGGNSAGSYIRHGALNKIQNQVPPPHPPQQIKELDEGVNKNSVETNKDSDNVNNFTKDQSNRMFGSSKIEDPTPVIHPNQYYQYPTQSQLYHPKNVKGNNTPPLSKKNVEIHDAELQHQPPVNSRAARLSRLETTAQPPPIQSLDPLPSLKDNIDNINSFDNRHQKKESGIQLPPITPSFQSNFPLPSAKQVAGYLKNADVGGIPNAWNSASSKFCLTAKLSAYLIFFGSLTL